MLWKLHVCKWHNYLYLMHNKSILGLLDIMHHMCMKSTHGMLYYFIFTTKSVHMYKRTPDTPNSENAYQVLINEFSRNLETRIQDTY